MKQRKKRKKPVAVTIKDKAHDDVYEAIRQGLDDVANGRSRLARDVFKEIRQCYDIPR